ncbi:MAG: thiamine-phosphate kinase [Porphyromonadaceae bacterium]|nr:thiamine-phosphate kinase [Porphyromonadaceae bacterium]
MNRTEISSLGEFGLIRKLTDTIKLCNESSLTAAGDDAAQILYAEGNRTLVSTDLLLEGIHFDLTYTPLRHLGYKAVVASIADIYAMNGTPRQILVGLGVSSRFAVEDLEELYAGINLACQSYGVDLVGGDTSASLTGLTLSMTALGEVAPESVATRSGAKPTDLICCTGDLGSAYMGLQLLEREKRVFAGEKEGFDPDFAGHEYILERQLKPELRLEVLQALRDKGIRPTSMIDISDGLSSELLHLCQASQVGVRIYEERLPIDYETARMAEEMNLNVVTVALSGGEDYEFLFTIPLGLMDQAKEIEGIRFIGHITEASLGASLITRDGSEIALRAQGWVEQQ